MKILKNNVKELVIWMFYLIVIIYIPLEDVTLYIYVVGLIALRILSNTHKLFGRVDVYSEKLKKYVYYLRMLYFISFAVMGIFCKQKKVDHPICYISTLIFILTGIGIVICEVLYLIQRKLENNEAKKRLKEQIEFEEKYDKIIFLGVIYLLSNIKDTALIRKLAYIISNNRIGSYNSHFVNIQDMLKRLKKENYIIEETINMNRGNASILCYSINKLFDNFEINFRLTPEMIYKLDNEKIVNRRKESISTITNDINVINNYLEEFNYKIVVFENDSIHYFVLLNEQQIGKLDELSE